MEQATEKVNAAIQEMRIQMIINDVYGMDLLTLAKRLIKLASEQGENFLNKEDLTAAVMQQIEEMS